MQGPNGQEAEARKPLPEYEVIESTREVPESSFKQVHQIPPPGTGEHGEGSAAEAPNPNPLIPASWKQRISKFSESPTRVYAAIGVGLGLLAGFICAAIFLRPPSQGATNDLGSVNSSAEGLKGHLTLTWNDKLAYHLTIEPGDPNQQAAFAFAAANSPHPVSFGIQLKDPFGTVLCGNSIVLKFDPRKAAAASSSAHKSDTARKANAAGNRIAPGIDPGKLAIQELDRERGKDIFQSNIAPGGQVTSISSQGNIPCSKKQYDSVASWSFTSDFPTIAQQAELLKQTPGSKLNGELSASRESTGSVNASIASAVGKMDRKPAPAALSFYTEGDDAIVWYDASAGMIETNSGKDFLIDKASGEATALKGRDFPIEIHYRCDQAGACTLVGAGVGVQHARLRK
jgi:hypothetical protein